MLMPNEYVIGSDECGWGPIAGPLVVCSVLIPKGWASPIVLRDSKTLSEKAVQVSAHRLMDCEKGKGLRYSLVEISVLEFDRMGPQKALMTAHQDAVDASVGKLPVGGTAIIVVDGNYKVNSKWPCRAMAGADRIVPAVMAASIIAKSYRDEIMRGLGGLDDKYNWSKNKGYPTPEHQRLLKQHGVSSQHRRSYGPVKRLLEEIENAKQAS